MYNYLRVSLLYVSGVCQIVYNVLSKDTTLIQKGGSKKKEG